MTRLAQPEALQGQLQTMDLAACELGELQAVGLPFYRHQQGCAASDANPEAGLLV